MKSDTQHLDYLISQYVDGCLDAASKKSLESQMVNDPSARAIYKDHRDVQDLLDDWGNRIPLIHWDEFDKKLAAKLEHETVGGQKISIFRRWGRPLSAAAALFVAAAVGYGWHAFSGVTPAAQEVATAVKNIVPSAKVAVEVPGNPLEYRHREFHVDEQGGADGGVASNKDVTVSAPVDVAATESLRDTVAYGLMSVDKAAGPEYLAPSSVHVGMAPTKRDERDGLPPAYP